MSSNKELYVVVHHIFNMTVGLLGIPAQHSIEGPNSSFYQDSVAARLGRALRAHTHCAIHTHILEQSALVFCSGYCSVPCFERRRSSWRKAPQNFPRNKGESNCSQRQPVVFGILESIGPPPRLHTSTTMGAGGKPTTFSDTAKLHLLHTCIKFNYVLGLYLVETYGPLKLGIEIQYALQVQRRTRPWMI